MNAVMSDQSTQKPRNVTELINSGVAFEERIIQVLADDNMQAQSFNELDQEKKAKILFNLEKMKIDSIRPG
jgi:hypothetical protein